MANCKTCENNCCPYAKTIRSGFLACSGYKAPPKTKTNADRIRSMSDEELACYLALVENRKNGGFVFEDTSDEWMKWLKQPAEEE